MTHLEQENEELKSYIKSLKASNVQKIATISKLNSIGVSLATKTDISSILKNILINIKEFTHADGGTIYLAYGNKLTFKHILNDTLNIVQDDNDDLGDVWNYLEIKKSNDNMIAVNCALNKEIIKIDNIETNTEFDFSGTKAFEKKTGYISKSMLVIPMVDDDNNLIGVLQLINKQDQFHKEILSFTDADINLAHSLASQASVAVNKFQQDKIIIQQSKMAAMGEMIDAIAHQWKQPLNVINMWASKLDFKMECNQEIEEDMLKDLSRSIQDQVKHLVTTLDDFRIFFRPNKNKETVCIAEIINSVLALLRDDIQINSIKVEVTGSLDLNCNVISNELKHIFINLINNSKDAFNSNNIKDRRMTFNISEKKGFVSISIIDTAGGIPLDIIDNIFKANITTKENSEGTGIGLYMSTQIAQKNHGELSVRNIANGAEFILNINN